MRGAIIRRPLRRIAGITGAVVLASAALGLSAGVAGAQTESIDQILGAAGPSGPGAPWAMISLGNFTANGGGIDNGNVAEASGSMTLNNPFAINGKVYLGQGVSYHSNITPTGGVSTNASLVSQAASAATSAASAFSGLTPTQTLGTLGNNSSITASASNNFNVIDIAGVNLTNGPLTLIGNSSSVFVINVTGNFNVSNGGIMLSGGVQAANVVWNISGNLTITGGGAGGATFYGTALDVNGQVTVHDDTWNGELIGGTITDTSGFMVNAFPPAPPASSIQLTKTVCAVMNGSDCSSASEFSSSVTVAPGTTVVFMIVITNTGGTTLTSISTTDAAIADCAGPVVSSLAPGATTEYTCGQTTVSQTFTNTASATGTTPSGTTVTSPTSSATAYVSAPTGSLSILKQVCTNSGQTGCYYDVNSAWGSSTTVSSGSTVNWRITITNTGSVALSNITTNDATTPDCGGPVVTSLAAGASTVYSCQSNDVTTTTTNTASASGTPPSGPTVTSSTSSATATVG